MGPLVKGNVLFKHGEVLWRTSGVMQESELLASYARKGMVQEINFLGNIKNDKLKKNDFLTRLIYVKLHPKRYNLLRLVVFYIRNDVISKFISNFASERI